jgi:hypothetical protein
LNSAVAIQLPHSTFLIHDDVQDGGEHRCGGPTLFQGNGIPIAVNVGNATNLLVLRRLMENRGILGGCVPRDSGFRGKALHTRVDPVRGEPRSLSRQRLPPTRQVILSTWNKTVLTRTVKRNSSTSSW